MMKRNMSRTCDKIAKKVRELGKLDEVTFCDVLDLSPSTFYNYRKHVTHRYSDIIFEDCQYVALEVEEIEPKTA